MGIFTPVRLDRVQRGLYEVIESAIDPVPVSWGYSEASYETLPANIGVLTMIGGPGPWNRTAKRGRMIRVAEFITLDVQLSPGGGLYVIRISGVDYRYDATTLDPIFAIRDSLVEQINADTPYSGVEASALPIPGGIALSPTQAGALRQVEIVGTIDVLSVDVSPVCYLLTEGTQTALINFQAYSKGREMRNGAWSVITKSLACLQTQSYVERLREWGIGLWSKGPPTDLSQISGAHWESRVSFDFTISMISQWAEPTDVIESVAVSMDIFDPTNAVVTQAEILAP